MATWLSKQRKDQLFELAAQAGLDVDEPIKKEPLVEALDAHLRANADALAGNSVFTAYYGRSGSPSGRTPGRRATRAATAAPETQTEPRSLRLRRQTYVKQESPESPVNLNSTPRDAKSPKSPNVPDATPGALQKLASNLQLPESPLPGPPSPSAVTDAIERQTAAVGTKFRDAWTSSGALEYILYAREFASSVVGVEFLALAVEALFLQSEVFPWTYAFDTPAAPAAGIHSHPVSLPNLFVLLEPSFWSVTLLWLSTSIFAPLALSYLFNFTARSGAARSTAEDATTEAVAEKPAYRADPLTYNVVKALVTYIVYTKGARFGGLVSEQAVSTVETALPGGHNCALIGAGIGALTTIYEAVLKR